MILLENKELSSLISSINLDISEYCFSNVYCFQEKHGFEYKTISGLPFVVGTNPGLTYLMPLFIPSEETKSAIVSAMSQGQSLYPIPEAWLSFFSQDSRFNIQNFPKDFDYVFLKDKLATMAGRKLSSKRNLISQFKRNCTNIVIKKFSPANQEDAIQILELWAKDSSDDKEITDYSACLLGIQSFEQLNLTGIVVYNNDKPIAFSLGEELHNNYILHFAKANLRCKGVYQFLFQETANSLPENITWINFEQDLGNPSLQKMKESYYPDKVVKKYTICLASPL